MSLDMLKNIIIECENDITFIFNNKKCGVTAVVSDFRPTYTLWYGDKVAEVSDVNEVLELKIFNDKSLKEIYSKLDFEIL